MVSRGKRRSKRIKASSVITDAASDDSDNEQSTDVSFSESESSTVGYSPVKGTPKTQEKSNGNSLKSSQSPLKRAQKAPFISRRMVRALRGSPATTSQESGGIEGTMDSLSTNFISSSSTIEGDSNFLDRNESNDCEKGCPLPDQSIGSAVNLQDSEITDKSTVPDVAESAVPDVAESTVPDVAESTVPDVAESTVPDVAESRVPDVAESTVPDVAESTVPDVAESTVPDVAESTVPDVAKSTVPDGAVKDFAEPTLPDTKEPAVSDFVEPAVLDIAEPAVSDIAEPAVSDIAEPAVSGIVEPAVSDFAEPAVSGIAEPAASDQVVPADIREDNPKNHSVRHIAFACSPTELMTPMAMEDFNIRCLESSEAINQQPEPMSASTSREYFVETLPGLHSLSDISKDRNEEQAFTQNTENQETVIASEHNEMEHSTAMPDTASIDQEGVNRKTAICETEMILDADAVPNGANHPQIAETVDIKQEFMQTEDKKGYEDPDFDDFDWEEVTENQPIEFESSEHISKALEAVDELGSVNIGKLVNETTSIRAEHVTPNFPSEISVKEESTGVTDTAAIPKPLTSLNGNNFNSERENNCSKQIYDSEKESNVTNISGTGLTTSNNSRKVFAREEKSLLMIVDPVEKELVDAADLLQSNGALEKMDTDNTFPSKEFLKLEGKAFMSSFTELRKEVALLSFKIYPIMKQIKEGLVLLAKSEKNMLHPLLYALSRLACGQMQEKPVLCQSGYSESEVEIFRKLSTTQKALHLENGLLIFNEKIVTCDDIHCDMFKLISDNFLVQSVRIFMELFKDEFILADKKLVNSHRECGCLQNPFSKYGQVLQNIPTNQLLSTYKTYKEWLDHPQQRIQQLALLGRGRRPTRIVVIVDSQLYPAIKIPTAICNENVSVMPGRRLTFSGILNLMKGHLDAPHEHTLFVVMAGLFSVLEGFTAVSFGDSTKGTVEVDLDHDLLSKEIGNSLIGGACNLWEALLCNTQQSDAIFLPASPLKLSARAPFLKGSQKSTTLTPEYVIKCSELLTAAVNRYNDWTRRQHFIAGYASGWEESTSSTTSDGSYNNVVNDLLLTVLSSMSRQKDHAQPHPISSPEAHRFTTVVFVTEFNAPFSINEFVNVNNVKVYQVQQICESNVNSIISAHPPDRTLYVLLPNYLSFVQTLSNVGKILVNSHAAHIMNTLNQITDAEANTILQRVKSLLRELALRLDSSSLAITLPFMPVLFVKHQLRDLVPSSLYNSHVLFVEDNLSEVSPEFLFHQYRTLNRALMGLATEHLEKVGVSPELFLQYRNDLESEKLTMTMGEHWPGHMRFVFHAWSNLVDSIKFKAQHGLAKSFLSTVEDLPFVDYYPTIKVGWKQANTTKRFQRVVLVGDLTKKGKYMDNANVQYFPSVQFSTNWMPEFLNKMVRGTSNSCTLYIFVLDMTMISQWSVLPSCMIQGCSKVLRVNTLPPVCHTNRANIQALITSKLKVIQEELVTLRKLLPNQSTVSIAPIPPQRVFHAHSMEVLDAMSHADLHKAVELSHPAGTYPKEAVLVGAKDDWLAAYEFCLLEAKRPASNLIINFNTMTNHTDGFTFDTILDCCSKLKQLSSSFPARLAWKNDLKRHVMTHLMNTFPAVTASTAQPQVPSKLRKTLLEFIAEEEGKSKESSIGQVMLPASKDKQDANSKEVSNQASQGSSGPASKMLAMKITTKTPATTTLAAKEAEMVANNEILAVTAPTTVAVKAEPVEVQITSKVSIKIEEGSLPKPKITCDSRTALATEAAATAAAAASDDGSSASFLQVTAGAFVLNKKFLFNVAKLFNANPKVIKIENAAGVFYHFQFNELSHADLMRTFFRGRFFPYGIITSRWIGKEGLPRFQNKFDFALRNKFRDMMTIQQSKWEDGVRHTLAHQNFFTGLPKRLRNSCVYEGSVLGYHFICDALHQLLSVRSHVLLQDPAEVHVMIVTCNTRRAKYLERLLGEVMEVSALLLVTPGSGFVDDVPAAHVMCGPPSYIMGVLDQHLLPVARGLTFFVDQVDGIMENQELKDGLAELYLRMDTLLKAEIRKGLSTHRLYRDYVTELSTMLNGMNPVRLKPVRQYCSNKELAVVDLEQLENSSDSGASMLNQNKDEEGEEVGDDDDVVIIAASIKTKSTESQKESKVEAKEGSKSTAGDESQAVGSLSSMIRIGNRFYTKALLTPDKLKALLKEAEKEKANLLKKKEELEVITRLSNKRAQKKAAERESQSPSSLVHEAIDSDEETFPDSPVYDPTMDGDADWKSIYALGPRKTSSSTSRESKASGPSVRIPVSERLGERVDDEVSKKMMRSRSPVFRRLGRSPLREVEPQRKSAESPLLNRLGDKSPSPKRRGRSPVHERDASINKSPKRRKISPTRGTPSDKLSRSPLSDKRKRSPEVSAQKKRSVSPEYIPEGPKRLKINLQKPSSTTDGITKSAVVAGSKNSQSTFFKSVEVAGKKSSLFASVVTQKTHVPAKDVVAQSSSDRTASGGAASPAPWHKATPPSEVVEKDVANGVRSKAAPDITEASKVTGPSSSSSQPASKSSKGTNDESPAVMETVDLTADADTALPPVSGAKVTATSVLLVSTADVDACARQNIQQFTTSKHNSNLLSINLNGNQKLQRDMRLFGFQQQQVLQSTVVNTVVTSLNTTLHARNSPTGASNEYFSGPSQPPPPLQMQQQIRPQILQQQPPYNSGPFPQGNQGSNMGPGGGNVGPGGGNFGPGGGNVYPGSGNMGPGGGNMGPGDGNMGPGGGNMGPGGGNMGPGGGNMGPRGGNMGPGGGNMGPGCGNMGPGCGNMGPGCGNMGPGCGNMGPGGENFNPGCGNMGPGFGNMGPGYGNMGPGYGNMGPGYGNMGPGDGNMGSGYGNMGSGYGNMGPGYGNMGPGYGNMGPGYGNMGPAGGNMGPAGDNMGSGYGNMGPGVYDSGNGNYPGNSHMGPSPGGPDCWAIPPMGQHGPGGPGMPMQGSPNNVNINQGGPPQGNVFNAPPPGIGGMNRPPPPVRFSQITQQFKKRNKKGNINNSQNLSGRQQANQPSQTINPQAIPLPDTSKASTRTVISPSAMLTGKGGPTVAIVKAVKTTPTKSTSAGPIKVRGGGWGAAPSDSTVATKTSEVPAGKKLGKQLQQKKPLPSTPTKAGPLPPPLDAVPRRAVLQETSKLDSKTRTFSDKEEMMAWRQVEHEYTVYLDVPDMHPDYEDHSEAFAEIYRAKFGKKNRWDLHYQEEWRKVWRDVVVDMLDTSWLAFQQERAAKKKQQIKDRMAAKLGVQLPKEPEPTPAKLMKLGAKDKIEAAKKLQLLTMKPDVSRKGDLFNREQSRQVPAKKPMDDGKQGNKPLIERLQGMSKILYEDDLEVLPPQPCPSTFNIPPPSDRAPHVKLFEQSNLEEQRKRAEELERLNKQRHLEEMKRQGELKRLKELNEQICIEDERREKRLKERQILEEKKRAEDRERREEKKQNERQEEKKRQGERGERKRQEERKRSEEQRRKEDKKLREEQKRRDELKRLEELQRRLIEEEKRRIEEEKKLEEEVRQKIHEHERMKEEERRQEEEAEDKRRRLLDEQRRQLQQQPQQPSVRRQQHEQLHQRVQYHQQQLLERQQQQYASVGGSTSQQQHMLERQQQDEQQARSGSSTSHYLPYYQQQASRQQPQAPPPPSLRASSPPLMSCSSLDVQKIARDTEGYNTIRLIKHIKEVLTGLNFTDIDKVYNDVFLKVSAIHVQKAMNM